jgi:ABC-2 type transport system permease protein
VSLAQAVARSADVVRVLVTKEFQLLARDKRMLAISLFVPVLQVILLGYAATTDITGSRVVVADLDRTPESREFVRRFTSTEYFVRAFDVTEHDAVDAYLERGDAAVALVVPPRFGDNLLAGREAPVQIILDGTDANTANILLGYATQIVNSYGAAAPTITAPGRIVPEPRVWFNPDLKSQHFMVPGVVALVLMIITMTVTALGIVKEKETGTLEQMLVLPIRPFELIVSKLIPYVLLAAGSVVIIMCVALFWFGVPLRGSLGLLAALSGLFILTTLGLGLFVSTIAKSQQQAMLIAQFFVLLPFVFLGGFAFPIANMPEPIQWLTYAIPLRYYLDILRGVFLKGSGAGELWFQAAMLAGLGGVIFTLSVMRFRRRLG